MISIEKTLKIYNKNKIKLKNKDDFKKFLDKEIYRTAKLGCYKIILYDYVLERDFDVNFKDFFIELANDLKINGYNVKITSDSWWNRLVISW